MEEEELGLDDYSFLTEDSNQDSFLTQQGLSNALESKEKQIENVEFENEVENFEEKNVKKKKEQIKEKEIDFSKIPTIKIPRVRNVTCNTKIKGTIDCKRISVRIRNSEYNPKRFPACIFKLASPKTTHLLFPSGRIICIGCKSEEDGRLALRKVCRLLQKLGVKNSKFENFTIQNMVANCAVGFPIRLEGLAYGHSKYCKFEPEVFPGVVYRMVSPKCCLLIFVSGRMLITGCKSRETIKRAFSNIYPVLLDFKHSSPQKKGEEEGEIQNNGIEENAKNEDNVENEENEENEENSEGLNSNNERKGK